MSVRKNNVHNIVSLRDLRREIAANDAAIDALGKRMQQRLCSLFSMEGLIGALLQCALPPKYRSIVELFFHRKE